MPPAKKKKKVARAQRPLDPDSLMLQGIDTSKGPLFQVMDVSQFFFARSPYWLRWLERQDALVFTMSGSKKKMEIVAYRDKNGARQYDLTMVEQIAHALASAGRIDGYQLKLALELVSIKAEMHGFINVQQSGVDLDGMTEQDTPTTEEQPA